MSSNEQLVLGAVRQKEASKKQSALQKLFAIWFDAFVYNQIWEDPRVDVEALKLDRDSRILTISSGGCNALNYLLAKPESVTAVDLNRHHIYLLNLKIAALRALPKHGDFFAFFGHGKGSENLQNYKTLVAPRLDKDSKEFWERGSFPGNLLNRKRIDFFSKDGLYEHSRNGYFLRFFHRLSHLLGYKPEKVLTAKSQDEQLQLFRENIAPFFDSFIFQLIGKMPITLFGLGIPPQQYEELRKDFGESGTIIDVYRERTKRLAVDFPIEENYFAWQAFARKYDSEKRVALPDYLKEENFAVLKNSVEKVNTKIGSITDEIKQNEYDAFNRFVFLDAQDWMNADAMTDLWSAVARKSKPGARIIFRTAGSTSPVENNLLPKDLQEKFEYHEAFSKELFKKDRASIYGGFHLYVLR